MKKILALFLMMTVALSLSAVPVFSNGPTNLIVNGDFEDGNTGFNTEYIYVDPSNTGPWTLGPEYRYTVSTDPNDYHSAWTSFGDHTSGTGKMMIVNGTWQYYTPDYHATVWQQEVTLPVCEPATYDLYAGQTWDIGEVLVKNDVADQICVKFVLTDEAAIAEGWRITQAHVAAAETPAGIPQKNGNPIPGKFPGNERFDPPGVIETDWICVDYEWECGEEVVVAAHAKIELPELGHMETYNFCVKSGTETGLVPEGYADIPIVNPWGTAVPTSVNDIAGCPCVADWIWDPARETSEYADNGDLVEFVQNFDIIGTPTSATLKIAADNAFAWKLNTSDEVAENLADGWRTQAASGNFAPTDPNPLAEPVVIVDAYPSGWSQVYTYDVLSDLVSGTNTLYVTGVNADWNTTSWSVNPGAVIFKLCGTSEQYVVDRPYDSETGWGAGGCEPGNGSFDGKNWATYICYMPCCPPTEYTLEFWAANSYPGSTENPAEPAILQAEINDVVVGTLALEYTYPTAPTPGWMKFSYTWEADSATSATIVIRDIRFVMYGDDFCIDDISFVAQ